MNDDISKPVPQELLADFGNRLVAFIIDAVILTILLLTIIFVIIGGFFVAFEGEPDNAPVSVIVSVVIAYFFGPTVIISLYHALLESSKYQGSVGKMVMKLKVVNMAGQRISFWQSMGRNLSRFFSGILMIGYLMPLFTDRKQALHDMIASTLVISSEGMITDEDYY